ncbi:MAG TPA: hypothetical protein VLL54_10825 [Pyrinomonadaceae bacterium]|nr:hypothetical protein [Pyrinomonadaceae bacterium]
MKNRLLVAFAFVCITLFAEPAYGCFCVASGVNEAFEGANAVFLGEVIEISGPRTSDQQANVADRFSAIRFKVTKSWKGISFGVSEINVLASQTGKSCLEPPLFLQGHLYLVYADPVFGESPANFISGCGGRTKPVRFEQVTRDSLFSHRVDDAYQDMKQLEFITGRAFKFDFSQPHPTRDRWKSMFWDFEKM